MTAQVEQLEFQAETRQLLDLMVHSVYSNKDTFLRELISNASDALDKLRLESFRDKDLQADTSDLHIELVPDSDSRTLTIRDNGIGMSRDEVIDLIGTLAKSGTAEARRALSDADSVGGDLIGQFGIGFYSTFMVADTVTLVTRRAGETVATRWESSGDSTYTIETVDVAGEEEGGFDLVAPHGTAITLHLKPVDTENHLYDYAEQSKLREIVKRFSDFIAWPIRMDVVRTSTAEPEEGSSDTEPKTTTTVETQTLNSMKALWTRPRDEVSDDEYHEFYRHVSHAWDEPLEIIPFKAEGTFEYQALLFLPSTAPFDLFSRDNKRGVQLYVRRVFIMDNCEELMPEYLRFVKGIVDAQDLSLNVSREILQQDRQLRMIQKRLVRKVLSVVKDLQSQWLESSGTPDESGDASDASEQAADKADETSATKYLTFWREFGRVLKEGLLSDYDNRETLLAVSSFSSTHSTDALTTLAQYVARMKEGQEHIYYMTGESRRAIEDSPHLEAFTAKGIEVLILTDPVDEMWVGSVPEYDGKHFQSIAKGEVDLESEEEKKSTEELRHTQEKEFSELTSWLKETLSEHVKEVRLSNRLTTSPACLVGDVFDFTPSLAKMYRSSGQALPVSKRILELNPEHELVKGLKAAQAEHPDDAVTVETAELLYGTAVLAEGSELSDPAHFAKVLANRLARTV